MRALLPTIVLAVLVVHPHRRRRAVSRRSHGPLGGHRHRARWVRSISRWTSCARLPERWSASYTPEGAGAARPAADAGRPRRAARSRFVLFNGGAGGGVVQGRRARRTARRSAARRKLAARARRRSCCTARARRCMPTPVKNTTVSAALEGTWTGSLDVGGNADRTDPDHRQPRRRHRVGAHRAGRAARTRRSRRRAEGERDGGVARGSRDVQGAWSGTLDGDALTGTWSQSGGSLPLTFTRTK